MISIKPSRRAIIPFRAGPTETPSRWRHAIIAVTIAGLGWATHAPSVAQGALPVVQLSAGMHLIQAEVAATARDREIGLMNRPTLPTHAGMLFVFEDRAVHCFWMKNTLVPLSIAFLDDEGRIVNIADMKPQTEVSHCPKAAVRYALEMNQGWFAKKGLGPGARIAGAPFPPR